MGRRRHFAAFAAAGLFAACYPAVDGTYDMGRVDMLAIFFVLCALYATRRMHPLFAALLWVCAFQTKQGVLCRLHAADAVPCVDAAAARAARRRRFSGDAGCFDRVADACDRRLVSATTSSAWRADSATACENAMQFIPDDLRVCGIALMLVAGGASGGGRIGVRRYAAPRIQLLRLLERYGGLHRIHPRASRSEHELAHPGVTRGCAVSLWRGAGRHLTAQPESVARVALVVVMLAAILQIAQLRYSLDDFVPGADEVAVRDDFESTIRSIPGDVLVHSHPEDARMAGKTEYASSEATGAVIGARNQQPGDRLMTEYAALIHSGRLSAVVLDWPVEQYLASRACGLRAISFAYYPLSCGGGGWRCASVRVAAEVDLSAVPGCGRACWMRRSMSQLVLLSSWYSCSVLMVHRLDLSLTPVSTFSTACMAVSMEWS